LETVRQPYLHVGLYFESSEGIHDLEIMNRTIDLCKFYKNKRYEPILQVVFKLFEETLSHWARSCPMKKVNHLRCHSLVFYYIFLIILQGLYYLKDVELNVEKLPPFFPEKSGIYDSIMMNREEKLFRIKVFFKIFKTFKGN